MESLLEEGLFGLLPVIEAAAADFAVIELWSGAFWISVAKIMFSNIVLSGDNAVVIAMASHNLPDRLRKRAKDVRSLPSDQRPRWTETDVELVDTVLTHLLKRRPKYSGKRLRELASKRGNGNKLADVQYRMMQLTSILESIDIADYELTDPEEVGEFHDDLVELQVWTERSVAYASAKLDDAALERKIRKLRDPSGRPAAEQRTANALADKLERRRRESRLAS